VHAPWDFEQRIEVLGESYGVVVIEIKNLNRLPLHWAGFKVKC